MSKIYLLRDEGDINNGFYAGGKYVDPDNDYFERRGVYLIEEAEGFNASQDIRVMDKFVC